LSRGRERGWVGWMRDCNRVSHGYILCCRQKPVPPVFRNRCHRVSLDPRTFVHIFKTAIPFSFPFLSLPFTFIFTQPSVSDMDLRDFDEMWEIQSLQSLQIRMSSFLWTWENLVIYG
jgi:hypothetical protein